MLRASGFAGFVAAFMLVSLALVAPAAAITEEAPHVRASAELDDAVMPTDILLSLLAGDEIAATQRGQAISEPILSGAAGLARTEVCGSIASNTTWTLAGSPYIVTCSVTVASGVTVVVEAGVVIKFQYQASVYDKRILIVNGILDLQSTAANPIVFTSDRDDTIGGDTNGDGSASQPAKGDWGYIKLTNSATIFHDAAVRYGGTHYAGSYYNYMLWVSNASPTIRNTTLAYASDTALRVDGGNPTITGNNVSDSINGIHVQNASPAISTNTVSRNTGCGIIVDGASGLRASHDQQQCHHRQRLSPVSAQLYLPHLQWQHHQR